MVIVEKRHDWLFKRKKPTQIDTSTNRASLFGILLSIQRTRPFVSCLRMGYSTSTVRAHSCCVCPEPVLSATGYAYDLQEHRGGRAARTRLHGYDGDWTSQAADPRGRSA